MAVELDQLEELSLISKVCTELENHLGLNDKDLGMFINTSVRVLYEKLSSLRREISGHYWSSVVVYTSMLMIYCLQYNIKVQPILVSDEALKIDFIAIFH